MDIYEEIVGSYLTIDRGLFLNGQYLVGEQGEWEAYPDFLAISFPENAVWVVEVTKTPGRGLINVINNFQQEYVPRIQDQLVRHRVIRDDIAAWGIGLWIFSRAQYQANIDGRLANSGPSVMSAWPAAGGE